MKIKNKKSNPQKTGNQSQIIRQKLAENLNISHLAKPWQDKIIFALVKHVSSELTMAAWAKLSLEDKEELRGMLQKSKEKKVLDFMSSKVKNFPQLTEDITKNAVADFKKKRMELVR